MKGKPGASGRVMGVGIRGPRGIPKLPQTAGHLPQSLCYPHRAKPPRGFRSGRGILEVRWSKTPPDPQGAGAAGPALGGGGAPASQPGLSTLSSKGPGSQRSRLGCPDACLATAHVCRRSRRRYGSGTSGRGRVPANCPPEPARGGLTCGPPWANLGIGGVGGVLEPCLTTPTGGRGLYLHTCCPTGDLADRRV